MEEGGKAGKGMGEGKEGGGETPLTPQPSNRLTFPTQHEETPADKYPLHYACREGKVDKVGAHQAKLAEFT